MPVRERGPRRADSWPARPVLWFHVPGSHSPANAGRLRLPATEETPVERDSPLEEREDFEPSVPLATVSL